jgi:5-methylcytosine-specific restriction endonuclease McrA
MRSSKSKNKIKKIIIKKYHNKCAYCGCRLDIDKISIDHIVALSRGGLDVVENMNPACTICNGYKSYLSIEEFRAKLLKDINVENNYKIYINNARKYIAQSYGKATIQNWDGRFYYEKITKKIRQ